MASINVCRVMALSKLGETAWPERIASCETGIGLRHISSGTCGHVRGISTYSAGGVNLRHRPVADAQEQLARPNIDGLGGQDQRAFPAINLHAGAAGIVGNAGQLVGDFRTIFQNASSGYRIWGIYGEIFTGYSVFPHVDACGYPCADFSEFAQI